MRRIITLAAMLVPALALTASAPADTLRFFTGEPDYQMAVATHPPGDGVLENEAADDFTLDSRTLIFNAVFFGLIPPYASLHDIGTVDVQIYRIFPLDSDTNRTPQVPTRTNSPGDVQLEDRSSDDGSLTYRVFLLDPNSGAANSVVDGIFPSPNQTTGGDGPVLGQEVLIDIIFDVPLNLAAGHYFIVPQVEILGNSGVFLWLTRPKTSNTNDLQMWTRNSNLDPDWLRVGTDIVGGSPAPLFNGCFGLFGEKIQ
jgi:hypothetical protein